MPFDKNYCTSPKVFIDGLIFEKDYGIENTEDEGEVHEIGCDRFDLVVKSATFVDKSSLIEKFFEHKRIFVTAPRSTGKSINMNMVKRFFEISVDLNGSCIQRDKSKNYELFSNSNLTLNIYDPNPTSFFDKHFGKYPVIFMRFKLLYCIDYDSFIRSVIYLVEDAFNHHEYLLHSNALTNQEKLDFKYYFDLSLAWGVKPEKLLIAMQLLTRLLNTHFSGTSCIVLIDHFDTPIQDAILLVGKEFDKIMDFINKFISNILVSDKYVERVFLTGCLRQAELYTPSNIQAFLFSENHPFKTFYGFTEDEIKGLIERLDTPYSMEGIREWYDGYHVPNDNLKLYNPYSIVKYFKFQKFENYWIQAEELLINAIKSETLEKIFSSEFIRSRIEEIVNGKTISIAYPPPKTTMEHVEKLGTMIKTGSLAEEDVDLISYFLLDIGYLTAESQEGSSLKVKVPNKEVEQVLKDKLYPVHHITTEMLPQ